MREAQRRRQSSSERARSRAPRSRLTAGGTASSAAVRVPGRGEYGKTCTLVIPSRSTSASVRSNAASSSAGNPTITSVVRLSPASGSRRRSNCAAVYRRPIARSTPSSPDWSGTCRCGDTVGVSISAATSSASTWLTSIEESRSRSRPVDSACLADEPGQRVTGGTVAEAAEVDAGQHDLAMPLAHAPTDLGEHRLGRAAPRCAAHERDHTERAGERAAVLDLHECPHAVEAVVGVDAADRADVPRDERRRLLACPRGDDDVRRGAGERALQVRRAARDVHRARRASPAGRRLP